MLLSCFLLVSGQHQRGTIDEFYEILERKSKTVQSRVRCGGQQYPYFGWMGMGTKHPFHMVYQVQPQTHTDPSIVTNRSNISASSNARPTKSETAIFVFRKLPIQSTSNTMQYWLAWFHYYNLCFTGAKTRSFGARRRILYQYQGKCLFHIFMKSILRNPDD